MKACKTNDSAERVVEMYILDYLKKFEDKNIKIFVDMDGVIADYEVGVAEKFHLKRPLYSSLEKLKEISNMNNVELFILSVTRKDEGNAQKQEWLDQYAPFFAKENRVILSRESNDGKSSSELKSTYIKNLERDGSVIVVIDDDPRVLFAIKETSDDVYLLKDTALVD